MHGWMRAAFLCVNNCGVPNPTCLLGSVGRALVSYFE